MAVPAGDLFHYSGLTGLAQLETGLGPPVRLDQTLPFPRNRSGGSAKFGYRRKAEVVLILPRPGGVLLHSKRFYPEGALRLPTGGVHAGEDLCDAAAREMREETGLSLRPVRFVFHLLARDEREPLTRWFHSLGLLFPFSRDPVLPQDSTEEIIRLEAHPWDHLDAVAGRLESLDGEWTEWGQFRAASHRLLHRIVRERPDWIPAPRD